MLDRRFDPLACSRCDAIVAIDAARAPLVEARRRCADLPGVRFEQMFVPEQWPEGVFELILLSEVVYYLSREDVGPPRRQGDTFLARREVRCSWSIGRAQRTIP